MLKVIQSVIDMQNGREVGQHIIDPTSMPFMGKANKITNRLGEVENSVQNREIIGLIYLQNMSYQMIGFVLYSEPQLRPISSRSRLLSHFVTLVIESYPVPYSIDAYAFTNSGL